MNTTENETGAGQAPPAGERTHDISRSELPLHCPLPSMKLWNSHPRVYLPIEAAGRAQCPYCGTIYILKD